jgi:hypothetical protein
MLRSIVAVVAGYLVFAVSAVSLFAVTGRQAHGEAPLWFMAVASVWGMVFAGLAGALAARIARRQPLIHAGMLTVIIATGAAVSIATLPPGGTIWSAVAAIVLMAPAATVGGGLVRRTRG